MSAITSSASSRWRSGTRAYTTVCSREVAAFSSPPISSKISAICWASYERVPLKSRCSMKCETPAFASGSSRAPAPIQNPSETERTLSTRSVIRRSPESSSERTYSCTGGWYSCGILRPQLRFTALNDGKEKPARGSHGRSRTHGTRPAALVGAGPPVLGVLHGDPRRLDRERRPAVDPEGPPFQAGRPAVGAERLRADLRRLPAPRRPRGRRARPPRGLHGRRRPLHRSRPSPAAFRAPRAC